MNVQAANLCNDLCPCTTKETADLYKELYKKIPPELNKAALSKFFPMQGCYYHKAFPKIMVVGRSVNGWEQIDDRNADDFAAYAVSKALSRDGFTWVNKNDCISTYTDCKGQAKEYSLHKSPFWRVIEKVVQEAKPWQTERTGKCLNKSEEDAVSRWFEYIVWTNLYPIAPKEGGNATEAIKKQHKEICGKLLTEQIKLYRPTCIVFITDWDGWFDGFADVFGNIKKIGDSETDNLVGKGEIDGIKAVVTVRPDRTKPNKPNELKMAQEIWACFR